MNDYAVHPILAAVGSGSIDGLDHVRYLLRLKAAGGMPASAVQAVHTQEQIVRTGGPHAANRVWPDGQRDHHHGHSSP